MRSSIFYSTAHQELAAKVSTLINEREQFLSAETINSPRTTGDALQEIISQNFEATLGDLAASYSAQFARRAMADLAFEDQEGLYYLVDIKTHRSGTTFSMPNLTSVERLASLYVDDKTIFAILFIAYEADTVSASIRVNETRFFPIEFLDWSCLTIGALGWGQIQISNSNRIIINQGFSRKLWMQEFCERVLSFYPREITKIMERIQRFETVKAYWDTKTDLWV